MLRRGPRRESLIPFARRNRRPFHLTATALETIAAMVVIALGALVGVIVGVGVGGLSLFI